MKNVPLHPRHAGGAVLAFVALAGCQSQQALKRQSAEAASVMVEGKAGGAALASMPSDVAKAPAPAEPASGSPVAALPRKIIYTGEIALVCEDLDKAAAALEARVKEFGGYIGNASTTGSRGETRSGSWTVRVASDKFETFLKALPALGELETSSRQAQDVSEEFYDVAARLKNKKIEEARLIELLQKATGRLTEVLTVEKELSRVRDEIERIEGRLRFLSNQTELSTVTITLREVKNFVPEGPPTLATQIRRAFTDSVDGLKTVGVGLILMVVSLVPWALPLGFVGYVLLRLMKKRRPGA